jgi:hypothetical protein
MIRVDENIDHSIILDLRNSGIGKSFIPKDFNLNLKL